MEFLQLQDNPWKVFERNLGGCVGHGVFRVRMNLEKETVNTCGICSNNKERA